MFDYKSCLQGIPSSPGVYRMLDETGKVLYVGKAVDLKKRVTSYFRKTGLSRKTEVLVQQVRGVEVTLTHTEGEALILENNLIKELRPRYNILLRDDKTYPYILLTTEDDYPRLTLHRGARKSKGRYFGPYPNAYAVRSSLSLLQKVFRVRQCEDSFFANRSRPCLQYQIKRCTAPCVNKLSVEEYTYDVLDTVRFLEGQSAELIDDLVQRMEQAANKMEFEQAAHYRDQISNLRKIQEKQYISREAGDMDIVVCSKEGGQVCVQVNYVRGGLNLGNQSFYPALPVQIETEAELLSAFLGQYYLSHTIPAEIMLNAMPEDQGLLEQILGQKAGYKVRLRQPKRGERLRWLQMAERNARHGLDIRLASRAGTHKRLEILRQALQLEEIPTRIECFDISHTQGEATVASCVVFNENGALKSDYRRFNIDGITPGDDYAAMAQVIKRRYTRLAEGDGRMPDLLLIDGGMGQLNIARDTLNSLQISGIQLFGVVKGEGRKPELDTLVAMDGERVSLSSDSPALHLVQQIRDEAHRFAITAHRQRRAKTRKKSALEDIPGIGAKRRQQLLRQFGGLREVSRAGVDDLCKIKGINRALAQQIYDHFHG
ncbi:MAG: excinuclease ABC subunit UvrC [Gammaproteobacteria bacterium]|nr:excinuclease ABC subunit UvrC [Gammaproteobacteria bacterium]